MMLNTKPIFACEVFDDFSQYRRRAPQKIAKASG